MTNPSVNPIPLYNMTAPAVIAQKKRKAIAVIGANYGDEGKGATVHRLVKMYNADTVIRFNGGNQAGHTVQLTDNTRHIFNIFGSGTFAGAGTYVSKYCLFNPQAAYRERRALSEFKQFKTAGTMTTVPKINLFPFTEIVSPWDIALNQFKEHGRGDVRHGSCGQGIGEAMFRILNKGPSLKAIDLTSDKQVYNFAIGAKDWFKARVKAEVDLGSFDYLSKDQLDRLYGLIANPSKLTTELYTYIVGISEVNFSNAQPDTHPELPPIIFEGAQGLLLDEDDLEHQPHVTWSKTGITNVLKLCQAFDLDLVEVHYVTRPYITRHGNGPMYAAMTVNPEHTPTHARPQDHPDFHHHNKTRVNPDNLDFPDRTNKTNDFQGSLRFGHMNWDKFKARVEKDFALARSTHSNVRLNIDLTCLDQVEADPYKLCINNEQKIIEAVTLPAILRNFLDAEVVSFNGLKG